MVKDVIRMENIRNCILLWLSRIGSRYGYLDYGQRIHLVYSHDLKADLGKRYVHRGRLGTKSGDRESPIADGVCIL